jgi:hypothetical protein
MKLKDHKEKTITLCSTLAAESVPKVLGGLAGTVGGLAVEPVVWTVRSITDPEYEVKATDGLQWAGGALLGGLVVTGPLGVLASLTSGLVSSHVADETNRLLAEVRAGEPSLKAPFIKACYDYDEWTGSFINAMTIASRGGTVWQHKNGLWVFISIPVVEVVDKKQKVMLKPVPDYSPNPKTTLRIFRPIAPLQATASGRVRWTEIKP